MDRPGRLQAVSRPSPGRPWGFLDDEGVRDQNGSERCDGCPEVTRGVFRDAFSLGTEWTVEARLEAVLGVSGGGLSGPGEECPGEECPGEECPGEECDAGRGSGGPHICAESSPPDPYPTNLCVKIHALI